RARHRVGDRRRSQRVHSRAGQRPARRSVRDGATSAAESGAARGACGTHRVCRRIAIRGVEERMSETILVVDDEENIRHTLRGVLADEGYDVVEAPDGRRALELMRRVAPRLAIVDVWMPEVDGIELVERMRTQAPGVPIIVISGHGTIETAVHVIRLGAFDFLEKPF